MKQVNKAKRVMAIVMAVLMVLSTVNIAPLPVQAATKKQSISLNYSVYTLKKGKTLKLKATVTPKKSTIVWKSNKKSVATVNSKGVVKALKKGTAKITATIKGTKKKATCKISVGTPVKKVSVTNKKVTLKVGEKSTIKYSVTPKNATNKAVTYTSSKTSVAEVNEKGVITAKTAGSATITVKSKDGSNKKAKISVTVEKAADSASTTTQTKPAPADPTSESTTQDSQTSQQPADSEKPSEDPGQSPETPDQPETPATVSVESVSVTPTETVIEQDAHITLVATVLPENATNKKVTFTSQNPDVAVVDSETGEVTAVKNGDTVITVTTVDGGKTATCAVKVGVPVTKIELSETEKTVKADKTFTLSATITPENATDKKLVWTSSKEEVATVDQQGNVKTLQDGTTVIKASTPDGTVFAECTLVVSTPLTGIALDPEKTVIAPEESCQIRVKLVPANAAEQTLTWSSSKPEVATVDNGVVTGVAIGSTTITAQSADGSIKASCEITVGRIVTVTTLAELTEALGAEELPNKIIWNTETDEKLEIPAGTYPETELTVNAPKATITNHAAFKKIEIQAISKDTWIEKATGNKLDIIAQEAHVVVEGDGTAIQIREGAGQVQIENNGTITGIAVATKADIQISGTNQNVIPIETNVAGVSITTSIPVAVDAAEDFTLSLQAGAENSTVAIVNEDVTPVIYGIGTVEVTNKETNEVTDQLAENITTDGKTEGETVEKGTITGVVRDTEGAGVNQAAVYVIPYTVSFDKSNLESAIAAAEEQTRLYATNAKEDGSYEIKDIPYGNYVLIVKADEKQSFFQTLVLNSAQYENEEIILTAMTTETGSVGGTLYDALTAKPAPAGISLYIRQGANNNLGDAAAETKTGEDGKYEFKDLPTGSYTIQVVDNRTEDQLGDKKRYVRVSFNTVILANTNVKENMTITTQLEKEQVRFVLTWGSESENIARDLDSHLTGPAVGGYGKFHTWFSQRQYSVDGERYADLDVDDTDYEGPETSTVYTAQDGVYHFYVYDYSNQSDKDNTKLAASQAKVNVYVGDRNLATYYVPNAKGTLWDVCTYDIKNNVLTPVNKVTFHPGDSSNVGMSPLDIAKASLSAMVTRYADIDLGETVTPELKAKLEAAKKLLEESGDADAVSDAASSLQSYVQELLSGTAIWQVTGEDLKSYTILRQGETNYYNSSYYYNNDYGYEHSSSAVVAQQDLKGYSVIVLQGTSDKCVQTMELKLRNESAKYEKKDSDLEQYQKLVIVTDEETGAVEKYYVEYAEYSPSLVPYSVTDEGNYIIGLDFVPVYDENGEQTALSLVVTGEEETLTRPVFAFYDSDVKGEYSAVTDDSDYVGKLKVTYGEKTEEYFVKYRQDVHTLRLQTVEDEKNYLNSTYPYTSYEYENNSENVQTQGSETESSETARTQSGETGSSDSSQSITSDYEEDYDHRGGTYYLVYRISGAKDAFSDAVKFTFDVDVEKAELKAVTDKPWNYEITVTYRGKEQIIRLQYTKLGTGALIPTKGYYYADGSRNAFKQILLSEDQVKLVVDDNPSLIKDGTITLGRGQDEALTYALVQTEAGREIVGTIGETEVLRIPAVFSYEPVPRDVTDADNVINSWSLTSEYGYDAEGKTTTVRTTYLYISGENDALTDLQVTFSEKDMTAEYTPKAEGDYAGVLTVTYPGGTVTYPVQYVHAIHTVELKRVEAADTYIYPDVFYDIYTTGEERIYRVKGAADELSPNAVYTFDVEGLTKEKAEKVENKNWTNEITVKYKGQEQVIRVEYEKLTDEDFIPSFGYYYPKSDPWNSYRINSVRLENSVLCAYVKDNPDNIDITKMSFSGSRYDFSYRVEENAQSEDQQEKQYVVVVSEYSFSSADAEQVKTVATYPLKLVYQPGPSGVTDGTNYIRECELETEETEDGYQTYISVIGENDTLEKPQFTFADENVTAEYTAKAEGDYVGVLTVTNGTQKAEYPVRYKKKIHTLQLKGVTQQGSYIHSRISSDEVWVRDDYVWMYYVEGLAENLTADAVCTFDVDAKDVTYTVTAVNGEEWTNEIKLQYKGATQIIYVKYTQMGGENFIPSEGTYYKNGDTWYTYFQAIRFADGKVQLYAQDKPSDIDHTRLSFYGYNGFTYKVTDENGTYRLSVYETDMGVKAETDGEQTGETTQVEKEIISYPIVVNYLPKISSVTDEGNAYVSCTMYATSEADAYPYYVYVTGENDTLTKPEFKFEDENVKATYQAGGDDANYAGTVTATNGDMTVTYPVRYERKLHTVTLQSVTKDGVYIDPSISSRRVYDSGYNTVYTVRGLAETMPLDAVCTFDAAIEAKDYTIKAVAEEYWTNEITLTYKGEKQVIRVWYEKMSDQDFVPHSAYYYMKDSENRQYSGITFTDGKLQLVVANGSPAEIDVEKTEFNNSNYVYKASKKDDGYIVTVSKKSGEDTETTGEEETTELLTITTYPLGFVYQPEVTMAKAGEVELRTSFLYVEKEDGSLQYYVRVVGEEAGLTNPEFTFSDETAKGTYGDPDTTFKVDADQGACVGTVSVQDASGAYKAVYPVVYKQEISPFRIETLTEEGNYINFSQWNSEWASDGKNEIWIARGLAATLGNAAATFDRDPDRYEINAVTDKEWTHEVVLEYKGVTQTIYLKYEPMSGADVKPTYGTYKLMKETSTETTPDEEGSEDTRQTYDLNYSNISWLNDGVVLIVPHAPEKIDLETIQLKSGKYGDFSYKVVKEEAGTCKLTVSYQEKEAVSYPLTIKYLPEIDSITEQDGTYCTVKFKTAEDGTDYLHVSGEEKSLEGAKITMADSNLKAEYVPGKEGDVYAGSIKITGEDDQEVVTYPVKYEVQEVSLYLEGLTEEGNELGELDSQWAYDTVTDEGYYLIYTVTGSNDSLDTSKVTVTVSPEADPANVTVQPVTDNADWNYDIIVVYKATRKVFHLKYTVQ